MEMMQKYFERFNSDINNLIKLFQIGGNKTVFFLITLSIISVFFEIIGISALLIFLSVVINGEAVSEFENIIYVLNLLYEKWNLSKLESTLLTLFLSFFISFAFKFWLSVLQTKFTFFVAKEMANKAFYKILNLNVNDISSKHSSHLIAMIITKVNICVSHILFPIISALTAFSSILFVSIFLLIVNFSITIFFLLIIFFIYLSILKISKKRISEAKINIEKADLKMIQLIQETLKGFREVKLYSIESLLLTSFNSNNSMLRDNQSMSRLIGILPKLVIEMVFFTIIIILAFIGIKTENNLILPFLGGFILAMQRLLPAINQVYFSITSYKANSLILDEVLNFIQSDYLFKRKTKKVRFIDISKSKYIKFNKVSYYYTQRNIILKPFTFKIPMGSKVLLKGETGSGKSTFLDLLCGFIEPKAGQIKIGETTLDTLNSLSFQKNISYISQSPYIFNNTIEKNISLDFKNKSDPKKIYEALKSSKIYDEIKKLKFKTNFILSENGENISGGQKQRISLSRAFYSPKKIMLFDESTNSISRQKELSIVKNILELGSNHTVFFTSHNNLDDLNWDFIIQINNNQTTVKEHKKV